MVTRFSLEAGPFVGWLCCNMGAYSLPRPAAGAAGAPIGQLDVKPLRYFRYTRRHGAGIFAIPETLR
jgi:hypothetical protein